MFEAPNWYVGCGLNTFDRPVAPTTESALPTSPLGEYLLKEADVERHPERALLLLTVLDARPVHPLQLVRPEGVIELPLAAHSPLQKPLAL